MTAEKIRQVKDTKTSKLKKIWAVVPMSRKRSRRYIVELVDGDEDHVDMKGDWDTRPAVLLMLAPGKRLEVAGEIEDLDTRFVMTAFFSFVENRKSRAMNTPTISSQ